MRAMPRRRPHVEQESYFVSMTDLMIGLLFIFIILLMSFAVSYRGAEREQLETEQRQQETVDRLTDNRRSIEFLLSAIKESLDRQGVQVSIDLESGILRLPESILFERGSAELNELGREALGKLVIAMKPLLPCFANAFMIDRQRSIAVPEFCPPERTGRLETILIEGHTDRVPITAGRFRDNWDLSVARAANTLRTLQDLDIGLLAFRNDREEPLIGVSGYAETRELTRAEDLGAMAANRRIDIRFIMAAPEEPSAREMEP
jgi:chemotaxis protein MotB